MASSHVTGIPNAQHRRYKTRFEAEQAYRAAAQNGQLRVVVMA